MAKAGHCLVCESKLIEDVVEIGNQYPSAIYPANEKEMVDLKSTSLNLSLCSNPDCALVQLNEISDLDEVFSRYPYESGTTATMKDILSDVASEATMVSGVSSSDVILDIGGNDGTMLSFMNAKYRVNIDAAQGVQSVIGGANDIKVVSPYSYPVYEKLNLPKPKLITSVAMFYHLQDPVGFCKEVAKAMDKETIFCMQMTYLGSMYDSNIYDNIVHEHRAYYSLHSLRQVFEKAGLTIYGAKIVRSYGGSIRVYAGLQKDRQISRHLQDSMRKIEAKEKKDGMNTLKALKKFNQRVQKLKVKTKKWIEDIVAKEGPIVAFGASTKGNMICQFLGLDKTHIQCVYDNNPRKIGSFLVGSGIPIHNENDIKGKLPKYVLILPYYYMSFFEQILGNFISDDDEHYLMSPLPKPTLIDIHRGKLGKAG